MDGSVDILFQLTKEAGPGLPSGPALFLGARWHEFLKARDFTLQQYFKPYADELAARGVDVSEPQGPYSLALVLLPKNTVEARYETARALVLLNDGGTLAIAAANDAGGKRVGKILKEFGLETICEMSGNKSRVAWGVKRGVNESVIRALEEGGQKILPIGFVSQSGLFAWNKIDKGSEILIQHLPKDLAGAGADFGCGYGFLSRHVLQSCAGVKDFTSIDADARAVQMCQKNLDTNVPVKFLWEDLSKPAAGLGNLDFIVMNPPFHEGKKMDADIGRAFINTAHASLKPGGQLWMVANARLPYESFLGDQFSEVKKITETQGFKIYKGKK